VNMEQSPLTSRGITDSNDRLLKADETLGDLQRKAGGSIPGTLAVPELLELVRHAREMDLKIGRDFSAFDGRRMVRGFARIRPLPTDEGGGCEVLVENWHRGEEGRLGLAEMSTLLDAADRAAAEVTARLDESQHIQFLNAEASDSEGLINAVAAHPGKTWTDYVVLKDQGGCEPLPWGLLDASRCTIPGSKRDWRARLIPVGAADTSPRAFELLLIPEQPLPSVEGNDKSEGTHSHLLGGALAAVLKTPIKRIIDKADTIHSRLAGPLRDEYSEYAGHVSAAGQHLSAMLDDLADLEVVEAPDFSTARERVDLSQAARRASSIVGVRAQSRGISIAVREPDGDIEASAEWRRVLQILINLLGNAIAYSPDGSHIEIIFEREGGGSVSVNVIDDGPGIEADCEERIFEKFERLGREGDAIGESGSGLGLYISRKLARAMGGDLVCVIGEDDNREQRGAMFRLSLPAAT